MIVRKAPLKQFQHKLTIGIANRDSAKLKEHQAAASVVVGHFPALVPWVERMRMHTYTGISASLLPRNYRARPSARQFVKAVILPAMALYTYRYGCLPPNRITSSERTARSHGMVHCSTARADRPETIHFKANIAADAAPLLSPGIWRLVRFTSDNHLALDGSLKLFRCNSLLRQLLISLSSLTWKYI